MDTDKTIKVSASNIKLAFWLVTILFSCGVLVMA